MSTKRAIVILAAGEGTRMKSVTPKVLHKVGGRPMLNWLIDLASECGAARTIAVVGAHSPQVKSAAETALGADNVVIQDPPLGTGHAADTTREALAGFDGYVLICFADSPLITRKTVEAVYSALDAGASVAVVGFETAEPGAYGRLVEDADGNLQKIVEAKEANPDELAINLCNSGVMAAPAPLLFDLLSDVGNDNAKGEYYLTDIVGLAVQRGLTAKAVRGGEQEVLGVNSKMELAQAEAIFQDRARSAALQDGAILRAPETVFFSFDTKLAVDCEVEPNVVFGPGVSVAKGAMIKAFSHLEGCEIGEGANVGPFARIRPGTKLGKHVKIGNFVETKKAEFGTGAKVSHLSYIGDAFVGAEANIGAGTITCNYDGKNKHITRIGAGAFVGSNSSLVAPVMLCENSYVGSGSVITHDVPEDALAVARGRQKNFEGWAARKRNKDKE